MEDARARWGVFAAGAAGVTLLFALLITTEPSFDAPGALAVAGAAGAAALAVAALAGARYRGTRDPHALFVAAAFGVLAVQEALFGIWWPLAHDAGGGFFGVTAGTASLTYGAAPRSVGGPAPLYASLAGWAVAGALLVLAIPWRERRGRPPVLATRVLVAAGVSAAVLDALLYVLYRDPSSRGTVVGAGLPDPGILGWILGIVAALLLAGASARTWRDGGAGRPERRWLSGAELLAVALVLAVVVHPTPGTASVQAADLLAPIVAALAFAGLLAEQRTEGSRQRRATDRAREVLGGRAEMASTIAHEVRGPVATIRGIASTSVTHYERLSDDEHREFLGMIEQESRRLLDTVDQMSLALKIDAGSLRVERRPQDLADTVRAGVDAAETGEHPVSVEAEAGVGVSVDWARMVEVVRQLVDNAAKFSPPDAPIRVTARREDGAAWIEVADDGPGIPPGERSRVVTKFPGWRPAGYEEQPGTGLGLFICAGLVAEHSGVMVIEEGPGGGTMLRVRLPAEAEGSGGGMS